MSISPIAIEVSVFLTKSLSMSQLQGYKDHIEINMFISNPESSLTGVINVNLLIFSIDIT